MIYINLAVKFLKIYFCNGLQYITVKLKYDYSTIT